MAYQGWFKTWRSIMRNKDYFDGPFDKTHAWIDILANVWHKKGETQFNKKKIKLEAGEMVTSTTELATRWKRNQLTVAKWLTIWQKEGRIKVQKTNRFSLITVVNWVKYQGAENEADYGADYGANMAYKENVNKYKNRGASKRAPLQKEKYKGLKPTTLNEAVTLSRDFSFSVSDLSNLTAKERSIFINTRKSKGGFRDE